MLLWRVILGIILAVVLIGACLAETSGAGTWLGIISLCVVAMASDEIVGLTRAAGLQPVGPLVHFGNLLIVSSAWLPAAVDWPVDPAEPGQGAGLMFAPAASLATMIAAATLFEIICYRQAQGATLRLAATIWPMCYVGLLFSFLVLLRSLNEGIGGVMMLLATITVVKFGDIGAYTVGRLIGRHKLAPHLSPGKTIEGAVGGLAASAFGAWLMFAWIWPQAVGAKPIHVAVDEWLSFGILVGLAGMVGDLAESLLKRDAAMKDSSRWLPGFGGVLDIVDSLLFAAPMAYFFFVWNGFGK